MLPKLLGYAVVKQPLSDDAIKRHGKSGICDWRGVGIKNVDRLRAKAAVVIACEN